MTTRLTPVISAERADLGGAFSARRVEPGRFGDAADPVMGFDRYRMDAVTFAPHPHAGFSSISYLFEDSAGGLRNRDSLGHDFVVEPGGILWTQAGSGVMHDELPAQTGKQVHGLQIFINLSAANKDSAPRVMRLAADEVPLWTSERGSRLRIMVGNHAGIVSPLEPTEPVNLFDLNLTAGDEVTLPLAVGWDMLVYAESGSAQVHTDGGAASLASGDAVAAVAHDADDSVRLVSQVGARLVILAGRALREPVVQHGPFIMNDEAGIRAAIARYQHGGMGVLEPIAWT
ncbi:pirin family protein [Croceicoccus bisphenolivorans]|uniref:pirin family protein n=1 Tax=Croceicoccus bisphenolivorans TaxID=1783232 RepID=UPI000834CFB8|nr:pirin-like C-terminal cupin domain-containing protein [Croceicoccus bisphenolivorans]